MIVLRYERRRTNLNGAEMDSLHDALYQAIQADPQSFRQLTEVYSGKRVQELLVGRTISGSGSFRGTITAIGLDESGQADSITIDCESCSCSEHFIAGQGPSRGTHHVTHFRCAIGLNTERDCGWVLDLREGLYPPGNLFREFLDIEEYVLYLDDPH